MSMPEGVSLDELNVELEAIQTIARALAGVRDVQTRLRILRWTNDRFAGAAAAAPTAADRQLTCDPSLSVDGVALFADDGIVEMADDIIDMPACEPVAPAAAAHAPDQPLDSLMRGFATDFRALALQWHGA
jgi:hypothetical protein